MAHGVDLADPGAQVAGAQAGDEPLPRRAVGDRGDGDRVVRAAGAVGELGEVEQSCVVRLAEGRHPDLAVRLFELVLVQAHHSVNLVNEEHDGDLARTEKGACGARLASVRPGRIRDRGDSHRSRPTGGSRRGRKTEDEMLVAALRDLQWRRRRFLIAVIGTALVFSMTLVLAGLSASFVNEIDRTIKTTGANGWVIATGATGPFNSSAVLGADTLAAARELPGVTGADPFVAIGATIPGDTPTHVMMIGAVPGGVGSPKVDDGRAPRRTGRGRGRQRGSTRSIGDTIQMGDKTLKVVGIVNGSSLFGGVPNVFLTLKDAQALTFGGAPLFTSIALRGNPHGSIEGARLVTIAETKKDLLQSLGSGRQTINFVGVLLALVAALIVGSVIYLSALERVRDFAVFKATGTGTPALLGGLAVQAVIVSLVAALIGALLALVLAPIFPMPAEIPTVAFLALPIVAVICGALASLAGLRRAVTVSPALAFGGA